MKLPKNFGGKGFQGMLAEAQSAMARAQNLETELAREVLEVEKSGVKAVFNGTGELMKLTINPELVDPEDVEMLEDMVTAVIRDGFAKATELRESKVQEIMPNVPGLDKLGL